MEFQNLMKKSIKYLKHWLLFGNMKIAKLYTRPLYSNIAKDKNKDSSKELLPTNTHGYQQYS